MSERDFPDSSFYIDQRRRFLRKFLLTHAHSKTVTFINEVVECLLGLSFPIQDIFAAVKVADLYFTGDLTFSRLCIKYNCLPKLTTEVYQIFLTDPAVATQSDEVLTESGYIISLGKNTKDEPLEHKVRQANRYRGDARDFDTANKSPSFILRGLEKEQNKGTLKVRPSEVNVGFEEVSTKETRIWGTVPPSEVEPVVYRTRVRSPIPSTSSDILGALGSSSETVIRTVIYNPSSETINITMAEELNVKQSATQKLFLANQNYNTYMDMRSERGEVVDYAEEQKKIVAMLESIMLSAEQCSSLDKGALSVSDDFMKAWLRDIRYTGFDPVVIVSIMKAYNTCPEAFSCDIAALVSLFLMRGTSIVLDKKLKKMGSVGSAKVKSLVQEYRIMAKVTDHPEQSLTVITLSRIAASFPLTTLSLLKTHAKTIERPVSIKQMGRTGFPDYPPAARTSTAFAVVEEHSKGTEALIKAILHYQILESRALMTKAERLAVGKLDAAGKITHLAAEVDNARTYGLAAFNTVLIPQPSRAALCTKLFGVIAEGTKTVWITKFKELYPDFEDVHLEFVSE